MAQQQQQSVLTVKAYFLNEVRRFQISTASSFEELKQTFYSFLSAQQVQESPKLVFSYQDDEEDWCKISNEAEFREALRVSKHLLRLKITREQAAQQQSGMNVDSGAESSSSNDESASGSGWPRCGGRGFKRSHCPRGFGWGQGHSGHGQQQQQGHGGPFGGFHPYFMQQKFANCLPQLLEMFTNRSGDGNNSAATGAASAFGDSMVHQHIVCDSCNEKGIRGTRHKCNQCPDYDLCDKCFKAKDEIHDPKHTFTAINNPIFGFVSQMMNNIANCSAQYQQQQQPQQASSSTATSSASAPQAPQKNSEPMEEEIVLEDAADQILYPQEPKPAAVPEQQTQAQPDAPFNVALLNLESMGFTNRNLNLHLLKQFNGNVEKVVESLIKFNSYSANN